MRRRELYRLMAVGGVWVIAVMTLVIFVRGPLDPTVMASTMALAGLTGIALGAIVYRIRQ